MILTIAAEDVVAACEEFAPTKFTEDVATTNIRLIATCPYRIKQEGARRSLSFLVQL
jgi:hypothetical protein